MAKFKIYHNELRLIRKNQTLNADLCLVHCSQDSSALEDDRVLHTSELAYYYTTLKHEQRKKSFLLGRLAAKHAIGYKKDIDLTKIQISPGVFMQPIVKGNKVNNIHVSISHNRDFGVAIAYPEEHPMGIDIEEVNDKNLYTLKEQLMVAEWNQSRELGLSEIQFATMLWTAREAISKVFKTGLMTPFPIYEISNIRQTDWNTYTSFFVNFAQYKAISHLHQRSVLTIVCPMNTEINIDNYRLHYWISERMRR